MSSEEEIKRLKIALNLAVDTLRYEFGKEDIKRLFKHARKYYKSMDLKPDVQMAKWFLEQAEEVINE